MSNFAPIYDTFTKMFWDARAWDLRDDEYYSVSVMDDRQIGESIITDLLAVTIYEKERSITVQFTRQDLVRFIKTEAVKRRVSSVLEQAQIQDLIIVTDDQIRIHPDKMEEAQDYAGVYFEESELCLVIDADAAETFERDLRELEVDIIAAYTHESDDNETDNVVSLSAWKARKGL